MVTNLIILISVVIFVLINFVDKSDDKTSLAIKYGAFYMPRIEVKKEYWRFITANFVHIDILHVFMNIYGIYYLGGRYFEPLLGTMQYFYLVLISALATSAACYFHSKKYIGAYNTVTLGASGIFYGFLGAMLASGIFIGGFFYEMLRANLMVIVINVAFTLLNDRVSKAGHLGGLIGGFIAMAMLIGSGAWFF